MDAPHMNITSLDALVDAFDGTTAFARWLDVGSSTVSNWKADGAIPRGYHLRIYLEAQRRGLRLDPCVFDMDPEEFDTRVRQDTIQPGA
jgi:hypothetical protein